MIRFDELAKDLAGGMKRREAFRRIGGGLAGALLRVLRRGESSRTIRVRVTWSEPVLQRGLQQTLSPKSRGGRRSALPVASNARPPGVKRALLTAITARARTIVTASAPPRAAASAAPISSVASSRPAARAWTVRRAGSARRTPVVGCSVFHRNAPPPCSLNPFDFSAEGSGGRQKASGK